MQYYSVYYSVSTVLYLSIYLSIYWSTPRFFLLRNCSFHSCYCSLSLSFSLTASRFDFSRHGVDPIRNTSFAVLQINSDFQQVPLEVSSANNPGRAAESGQRDNPYPIKTAQFQEVPHPKSMEPVVNSSDSEESSA